jgi:hypothetical protein
LPKEYTEFAEQFVQKSSFSPPQMIPTNISNPHVRAPDEQNVQPGTVVDRGVMDAAMTEFLLVAHRPLHVRN